MKLFEKKLLRFINRTFLFVPIPRGSKKALHNQEINLISQHILILILFFLVNLSFAQKDGFVYEADIPIGASVYVMTNQVVIQDDSATYSWAELIDNEEPDLYKATFLGIDSILYEKMDADAFFNHMKEESGNWLMFVHGAGKTFQRATWRAFDIAYYQNINVIAYSWPAANPKDRSFKGFEEQLVKFQQSVPHLKTSLELVQRFKNEYSEEGQSFNLLLHSMGNMLLEELVNTNNMDGLDENLFDNLIVNAASVKEENHKTWIEKLNIQQQIYITMNKGDVNLKGVRAFLKLGIQLGQKVKSPIAENAQYINFTKAIGFKLPPGKSHTYFIAETAEKHPEITAFYHSIFNGQSVDLSNPKRFKKRKDGIGYTFLLD